VGRTWARRGGILPVASFTYSPAGDLLATHTYTNDTDYITETYAYDMLGNRIATTDAFGNTIHRTYDPFGRILSEWGATYPVRYTYDTQGRRTSLSTTRDGTSWDTTTWTYDPFTGNCLSKTYADGSTVIYTYTPDNLLLRTTYPSGKWKENVYDAQRRLSGVVCSSHNMDYELQLDAYGNATNVEDAVGNNWRYDYGFNSKLLTEEYANTGGTRFCASATTNSISRSYDSFDRPSGFAFAVNEEPKGRIGYAYDDAGDLTRITVTNSAGRSFSVAYTNNAGYSCGYTITTPDGDTIRRVVDRDDCRRSLVTNCATYFNSSLVDSNRYDFDALSRPVARTTGTTGVSPVDSTFAYNNRSEVVSAAIGTNSFAHAYDDIGNHLLFGDNAVTNTYTHNNLNQITTVLCVPASPRTIHHNADGGMSSDGTWSYAYDAEDQLRSVTSRSLTNGAIRVRNAYDYRHRRTSKTVQRLNAATALPPSPPVELREGEALEMRTFVYDDWNLIHETVYTVDSGVTNVTEIQYFWGLDLSGTIQGAGDVGGLLAVSRNGQLYFPTFDNNGNVTKYIDESGNVVAAYEYDDFGRTISQTGPLADFFRHRFSTKYYDPETGLYYYGYRFYSSTWRIWLNRDPIEETGGLQLQCFLENSPLYHIDGLGEAVFIMVGGLDNESRVISDQQRHMKEALNIAYKAWLVTSRISEKKYECLKNKGRVYFNGKRFNGTRGEYIKKIKHELDSTVRNCNDYDKMLKEVSFLASKATADYDHIVVVVHGEPSFADKNYYVGSFVGGSKSQSEIRAKVYDAMQKGKGEKVFASCFQTTRSGHRRKEGLAHYYPRFIAPDGSQNEKLLYQTHRVRRIFQ